MEDDEDDLVWTDEDELDERVLRILRTKQRYLSRFYNDIPPGH